MDQETMLNRDSYNRLARKYAGDRLGLKTNRYLTKFMHLLPRGGRVLDVGCGPGIPVDQTLIQKGFLVTGIDIAEKMVALAQKNCPRGSFFVKDMLHLQTNDFGADEVVCLYALFHIGRKQHGKMLTTIASFLPQGGPLLLSMGDKDFEGEHQLLGETVFSSHFGPDKNRQLIREAGFDLVMDEINDSGGERHQVILAVKH